MSASSVPSLVPDVVDSLAHPLAVQIRSALDRGERRISPRILIDDAENILQAVKSGVRLESVFYTADQPLSPQLRQAIGSATPAYEISRRTGKKLFENEKVSRIFALAREPVARTLQDLAHLEHDLIALENLGIAGNTGAIIRTAAAFGAGAVVMLGAGPADVYDRRLIRASRGHVFSLPVVRASGEDFVRFCKQGPWKLVVTDAAAAQPVQSLAPVEARLAIAFGNEIEGCSELLRRAADLHVRIPIHPRVESLNVSAAAGIVLFSRSTANSSPPSAA